MTLGKSWLLEGDLAKAIQLGWWHVPINSSPSQFEELGILRISDQGGSWINMILNWFWISRMVLMMTEFLQMFCEKTLRFFTIIDWTCRSLQNEAISTCFHRFQHTFWCAIPYWSDVSKMGSCWSWLGGLLCSLNTWMSGGMVCPSWFLI